MKKQKAKRRTGGFLSVYLPEESKCVRSQLEQVAAKSRRSLNEVLVLILANELPRYVEDTGLLVKQEALLP